MHLFHLQKISKAESPFGEEQSVEHAHLHGTNARGLNKRFEVFLDKVICHRPFPLKSWLYWFIILPFLQKDKYIVKCQAQFMELTG